MKVFVADAFGRKVWWKPEVPQLHHALKKNENANAAAKMIQNDPKSSAIQFID